MGLFHSRNIGFPDFSPLGTDLHCHVLPGMDDGASTMNESIRMLTEMARLGFSKIIATPHVISSLYPNTRDQIEGQVFHLQEVIFDLKLDILIEGSGEYHMDDELLGLVQKSEVIPFGQRNYLLIELPWEKPRFSYEEILREIQILGYMPVIAHPERYGWMMGNMKLYQRLKDFGVLFQLNINSLNSLYGFPSKYAAHQLIDAGMISFAGSDAHYMGHITELQKALQNSHFAKLVNSGTLLNGEL